MATGAVAAAGTALALYYWSRRGGGESVGGACGVEGAVERETHANVHSAPTSFMEDLYFFAEGLRCEGGAWAGWGAEGGPCRTAAAVAAASRPANRAHLPTCLPPHAAAAAAAGAGTRMARRWGGGAPPTCS